ncbi:bifunctional adenosylcobinamide kinase/adenosylcobinamide-phosphate guanylyltransferase [Clostridium omnivorum]|uniref:bifunctional adenosylcobinamide kinase/adenosylcobinamide-phosphate guanylyltransferase n=1 Tax=Clostridium omnivorum TaxID=1604902 RepID=UPI0022307ED9|nr:bifunctional adenosylcobinamide kinase/adenosylcobinamide-phosphate guanylyltransferase [Clostridium sp. E14]
MVITKRRQGGFSVEKNRVILVTGGSRSGKSKYAEEMLKNRDEVLYIATAIITDAEMENRIKKHIERRNEKWTTYEGFKDLDLVLESNKEDTIMLDCVTIMLTNLMFSTERDFDNMSLEEVEILYKQIENQFYKLISKAKELNKTLIMVTNEVGYGLVPEYKISRIFRDMAGSINQFIASLCDEVYLVACGLPVKLK